MHWTGFSLMLKDCIYLPWLNIANMPYYRRLSAKMLSNPKKYIAALVLENSIKDYSVIVLWLLLRWSVNAYFIGKLLSDSVELKLKWNLSLKWFH